jgi:hypothetical protein
LTLQVPSDRLYDAFATFTPAEKAQAVQSVLQARVDAALENGL